MKSLICAFFLCTALAVQCAFGQGVVIGSVHFTAMNQADKPDRILAASIPVFEDNVKNKGRQIQLHVEVLPAHETTKAEPMFIIMGGPGQASSDLVTFFGEILAPINQRSDLVFIDQRGTGRSNPLQLKGKYISIADYFTDDFMSKEVLTASHSEFAATNDLKMYGTENAVVDLEYVRSQMGYETINLYGTSYGTRVGLAYIQKYPHRVRTATLKGLVPTNTIIPMEFARDAQRSFDLLLSDPKCKEAFPDLSNELKAFMSGLPKSFEMEDPATKQKQTVTLGKGVAALTLRVLLMSPSSTKSVPWMLQQWNQGNYEPFANMVVTIKKSYIKGVYDGMTLCVVCYEDYPLLQKASTSETFLGSYWTDRVMNACAIWNPAKAKNPRTAMKKQDVPVLLISGNRDGATPPKYGEEVLKFFPTGRHLVVPSGSHSFDGMRNCVENVINEFVITGQNKTLSFDCADRLTFPDYKLN